jgi:hypothetical protein
MLPTLSQAGRSTFSTTVQVVSMQLAMPNWKGLQVGFTEPLWIWAKTLWNEAKLGTPIWLPGRGTTLRACLTSFIHARSSRDDTSQSVNVICLVFPLWNPSQSTATKTLTTKFISDSLTNFLNDLICYHIMRQAPQLHQTNDPHQQKISGRVARLR